MKKILSYILILVIISVNLFAPISVGWGDKNIPEINKNVASAEYTYSLNATSTRADTSITINVELVEGTSAGGFVGGDELSTIVTILQVTGTLYGLNEEVVGSPITEDFNPSTKNVTIKFNKNLIQDTQYKTKLELIERVIEVASGDIKFNPLHTTVIDTPTIKTGETAVTGGTTNIGSGTSTAVGTPNTDPMPDCGVDPSTWFTGCLARAAYYILYVPTSYMFALAGVFFDNTFAYSVQDSSYRSAFVVQGWGLVRDLCNMFFIFVLLYVAIGTVLSLNSVKTKEMIINIVIIGIFINFSLFATQILIDASNILARVFYNSDTIKVTQKGGAKIQNENDNGVISLSAALVDKVNPQNIILNAHKMEEVPTKDTTGYGQDKTETKKGTVGAGTFFMVTLLATMINIVGIVVFVSVGLIFIVRVVGLWLAMIFAPLAFFTYTVPYMQDMEMIGWKKWWPETIKLAFLAPVFVFFMYIILGFLEMDLIADADNSASALSYLVAIIIPFAFIMILLMKAKTLATDMSGTIGKAVAGAIDSAGKMAGGAAVGVMTGGLAMAGRATLGKAGTAMANSAWLAKAEAKGGFGGGLARMALKGGDKLGGASFDARNTAAGKAAGGVVGTGPGFMKPKEGGFTKAKADREASRTKRVDDLKKIASKPEEDAKRKTEATKKMLEDKNAPELNRINADLVIARQQKSDAADGTPDFDKAVEKIKDLNDELAKINSGGMKKDGTYNTDNGNISEKGLESAIKNEADATRQQTDAETRLATAQTEATNAPNNATNTLATETAAINTAFSTETAAINTAFNTETATITTALTTKLAEIQNKYNTARAKSPDDKVLRFNLEQNYEKEKEVANKKATISLATSDTKKTTSLDAADTKKTTSLDAADIKKTETIKVANAKVIAAEYDIETAEAKTIEASSKATTARASANNGGIGKSITDLKLSAIKQQENIDKTTNKVAGDYAKWIESDLNKLANVFSSGNTSKEYSVAADKIRMGIVTKSGEGRHSAPKLVHTPISKPATPPTPATNNAPTTPTAPH